MASYSGSKNRGVNGPRRRGQRGSSSCARGGSSGERGRGDGRASETKAKIRMMSGEALKSVSMSISEVESDPAAFRRMLELQGVAIISEVASAAECLELERVWEQSMLALNNGIAEAARGFTPGMGNGFTPLWGLPHCEFSWRCRTHQKGKRLFELIYQTQELCASMDLPFYLPRASTGAPKVCTVAPHADQNVHVPESGECVIYQSILYVWDSTDPAT